MFFEHEIEKYCKSNFNEFISVYERINHQLWHLYSLNQISKEELRYQRFYKSFLHFKYDNLKLAHIWADDYLKISPYKTHLIDGAIDVLLYLKNKYHLHIITNGFKEVQHIKLDYSNLKSFFKHIIISEEHGFNKPDIEIFHKAEQLSNANSYECVMVGDNFDTDIKGALNANWKAIYLADKDTNMFNQKCFQIKRLIELKEIF